MPSRRVNPNRVKTNYSYTVSELAECLGMHRNTVRHWQRKGLDPIDDRRPYLFKGEEVRAFLRERRASRKRPCAPGTIFCVSCREQRRPAMGMVDYIPLRAASGNLRGICEVCETVIHRQIRFADLQAKMPGCEVKIAEGP